MAASADYEKWKADMKATKEPEPKQVFTEKQKKWAKDFLTTPSQAELNMPDDYGHELRRQAKILKEEKEESKKKVRELKKVRGRVKKKNNIISRRKGKYIEKDIIG